MRKPFLSVLLAMMLVPVSALAAGGKKHVIALSNSFYGNSWRKQMVDTMQDAAKDAKAKGLISDFIVANGDGTENTQIQQMNSLILQNVDAIVINAASLTGLNGVIGKAHQKGIKVVAFDSIVSSPYAYKIEYDFKSWGSISAKYIVDRFKGNAKVLITRGVMGSAPEKEDYEAMMEIFKANPGIKILGEVDTEADIAKSQSAVANVLPSFPDIDATVGMSAGYGVVQAFQNASRKVPVIIGSNRAEFINWWADEKAKSGYETISLGSEPSIGAVAFWYTVHLLKGDKVPDFRQKSFQLPLVPVTNANVDQFKGMQPGTVIAQKYDDAWVIKNVLKQ
ncbi:MAG TPA: substrate-binding domain-containing protein [Anaeromyxobacter sp.]|nr:substrate-binding domain-containing protein [Anaeromyxobacter sp.]